MKNRRFESDGLPTAIGPATKELANINLTLYIIGSGRPTALTTDDKTISRASFTSRLIQTLASLYRGHGDNTYKTLSIDHTVVAPVRTLYKVHAYPYIIQYITVYGWNSGVPTRTVRAMYHFCFRIIFNGGTIYKNNVFEFNSRCFISTFRIVEIPVSRMVLVLFTILIESIRSVRVRHKD